MKQQLVNLNPHTVLCLRGYHWIRDTERKVEIDCPIYDRVNKIFGVVKDIFLYDEDCFHVTIFVEYQVLGRSIIVPLEKVYRLKMFNPQNN